MKSDRIYERFNTSPLKSKLNGVRKYHVDISELKLNMRTFYFWMKRKSRFSSEVNRSSKESGGEQVHLDDHMEALCDIIQFDPQTFTIEDVQYDGAVIDDTLGGRKALDTVHFPRMIDRQSRPQRGSDKCNVVRIKNLPRDMSDKDILNFLKDEVDNKIGSNDIKSEKTDNNTRMFYHRT